MSNPPSDEQVRAWAAEYERRASFNPLTAEKGMCEWDRCRFEAIAREAVPELCREVLRLREIISDALSVAAGSGDLGAVLPKKRVLEARMADWIGGER